MKYHLDLEFSEWKYIIHIEKKDFLNKLHEIWVDLIKQVDMFSLCYKTQHISRHINKICLGFMITWDIIKAN